MPDRTYRNPLFMGTNKYRFGFNDERLVLRLAAIEWKNSLDKEWTEQNFAQRGSPQKWRLHVLLKWFCGEFGSLTHYDYGFRIYNPSIGRFLSVDPLAKDYSYYSPYQFAGNSPIQAIDIDGLEKGFVQRHDVIIDEKGNFITKSVGKPILVTENGDWPGYKTTNKFFHNGKDYYSQGDIPGWTQYRDRQQAKVNRQAKNVALVVGGIVTIATFIPSGGQSATAFTNLVAGFGITSGIYGASSGITKFSLELTDHPEISDKVPNGLLNATVGLVIKSQINDNEVIETIDAVLSITEGIATFNFKDVNSIQKFDNFMNILNNKDAINKTIDLILPNNDNKCDDKCDK